MLFYIDWWCLEAACPGYRIQWRRNVMMLHWGSLGACRRLVGGRRWRWQWFIGGWRWLIVVSRCGFSDGREWCMMKWQKVIFRLKPFKNFRWETRRCQSNFRVPSKHSSVGGSVDASKLCEVTLINHDPLELALWEWLRVDKINLTTRVELAVKNRLDSNTCSLGMFPLLLTYNVVGLENFNSICCGVGILLPKMFQHPVTTTMASCNLSLAYDVVGVFYGGIVGWMIFWWLSFLDKLLHITTLKYVMLFRM